MTQSHRASFLIIVGTLLASSSPFANASTEVCDLTCASKLASQIQTLREEVKNAIPIGTILPFSGANSLPEGYILCDGSALSRDQYPELFQIIGYTYMSSQERGTSEFRVPDLRGRVIVGTGKGDQLTQRSLGDLFGVERASILASELPPHTHSGITGSENRPHTHKGTASNHDQLTAGGVDLKAGNTFHLNGYLPTNAYSPNPFTPSFDFETKVEDQHHEHSFKTNGGDGLKGDPHDNLPPSAALNYMIRIK